MSALTYANRDGVPKLEAGQWAWVIMEKGADPAYLAFGCPCGTCCTEGSVVHNGYIAVSRKETKDPHQWNWDGNWDEPTLSPSIRRHGSCNWHGYLVKGKFSRTN